MAGDTHSDTSDQVVRDHSGARSEAIVVAHGQRDSRDDRSRGLPDRVRHLAARWRVGRVRRGRGDRRDPPGPRAGRQLLRHRAGLRLRRLRAAARAGAARRARPAPRRGRDRHQGRAADDRATAWSATRARRGFARASTPACARSASTTSTSTRCTGPTRRSPSAETAGALERARRRGQDPPRRGVQLRRRRRWPSSPQTRPVETLQPPYHLFRRDIEDEVLPYTREHDIGVLVYGPLAHGLLTGTHGREHHVRRRRLAQRAAPCSRARPSGTTWRWCATLEQLRRRRRHHGQPTGHRVDAGQPGRARGDRRRPAGPSTSRTASPPRSLRLSEADLDRDRPHHGRRRRRFAGTVTRREC